MSIVWTPRRVQSGSPNSTDKTGSGMHIVLCTKARRIKAGLYDGGTCKEPIFISGISVDPELSEHAADSHPGQDRGRVAGLAENLSDAAIRSVIIKRSRSAKTTADSWYWIRSEEAQICQYPRLPKTGARGGRIAGFNWRAQLSALSLSWTLVASPVSWSLSAMCGCQMRTK